MESNIEAIVDEIYAMFGGKVSKKEIERKLKFLVFELWVPEDDAKRTIINGLRRDFEIDFKSQTSKISEIQAGALVNIKAKVLQLWEPRSPAIAQTGLIGDETGVVRFVVWTSANKMELKEGKCYIFKKVAVDEFNGIKSIKINASSSIEEIDEDIEVKSEIEFSGAIVSILQNSGLIAACKICGLATKANICPRHGKVETIDVLRVRAVIDDGKKTYGLVMSEEIIKSLVGIDLNEAKRMAEIHLDRNVVTSEIKKKLFGKYLKVSGDLGFGFINIKKAEFYKPKINEEVTLLLERVGQ